MTSTVRYDPDHDEWFFDGERRYYDGAHGLVVKRNDLTHAKATDLARALRKAHHHELAPEAVLIDLAPDDHYEPKESLVDATSIILLDDGRLAVRCGFSSDEYMGDDDRLSAMLTPLVQPLLRSFKAALVSVEADGHRSRACIKVGHSHSLIAATWMAAS